LKLEEQKAKAQEASSTMVGGEDDQRRTLWDFVTPGIQGIAFSTVLPNVEAQNFKLKPALISLLQQFQFGGTPLQDPTAPLGILRGV